VGKKSPKKTFVTVFSLESVVMVVVLSFGAVLYSHVAPLCSPNKNKIGGSERRSMWVWVWVWAGVGVGGCGGVWVCVWVWGGGCVGVGECV